MLFEIHCHTSEKSPCSFVSARDLITRAFEVGMDGIVITDHHYLWSTEELATVKAQAGVPDHFVVLSGQETTTAENRDVLVYGADQLFQRGTPVAEIRKACPHAAIVWAHPYRQGGKPDQEQLTDTVYDAIEILNSNHTFTEQHRAVNDWHSYKFTATAGTDAHALSYVGTYPTIVEHPVETAEQFAEEIKAGRCRPDLREVRRAGTTGTRIRELAVGPEPSKHKTPNKIINKIIIIKEYEMSEEWQSGDRAYRIMTVLRNNGFDRGECQVPEPLAGDSQHKILIEEKARGKELYTVLVEDDRQQAEKALKTAAKWLAKLHNLRLQVTTAEEFCATEPQRLNGYVNGLHERDNPHRHRVQGISDFVLDTELQLVRNQPQWLVQCHGDFHLKNIFYDNADGNSCVFAIDFDSSHVVHQAFDVGTFLAQYDNMFYHNRSIFKKAPAELFFETYLHEVDDVPKEFRQQVHLFRTRAYLSILYYLAKVNMGDSENFWNILLDAEKSLAFFSHAINE